MDNRSIGDSDNGVDNNGGTISSNTFEALQRHSCYDLLPVSYRIIVLDTSLVLKKALAALVQHGIQSAPLWDSELQQFAGMLTATDFIQLIIYYYDHKASYEEAIEEIDQLDIAGLRALETSIGCLRPQSVTIHPLESLYEASRLLLENHLHRLPLVDRGPDSDTIVSVVTQSKILRFVAANVQRVPEMDHTLKDLGIGSYTNLETANHDTPLITVLRKLISRRISSLPIVDQEGRVLNVYEKYDVLMLAKEGPHYNLDMPVKEALLRRSPDFEGIHSCSETDTLAQILQTIGTMTVHRFIVLKDGRLHGVISLSDILKYLLQSKMTVG